MILKKEAFDPEAVFMDDIVEDDVLPRLSLAVDGLTESGDSARRNLEMPSEDTAMNQVIHCIDNHAGCNPRSGYS